MKKLIKIIVIFLGVFAIFSSYAIAADLILPLPKPIANEITKKIIAKNKIILPKKKIIIKYDSSKPNGIKRKVMDVSLARKYGWKYTVTLKKAILSTYQSYQAENKKK